MYLACAQSHFPDMDADNIPQWFPFYECMEASTYNKGRYGPYNTTAAIACAEGLFWDVISDCAGPYPELGSSDDGNPLMQSIADATPEHTYVPWVVVNGDTVPDDGNGYPSGDLTEIVCKAYEGEELPDALELRKTKSRAQPQANAREWTANTRHTTIPTATRRMAAIATM